MNKFLSISIVIALAALVYRTETQAKGQKKEAAWMTEFAVDKADLSSIGRNPYFILEPGHQRVYEGGKERLVITVLAKTKTVDGVETRIVEERETKNGKLIEVSRNYFAISKRTKDVFYFGEDVDMYKDGKVVNHEGAWLAGIKGAKFGMMMPGKVQVKARFYQEVAPKIAMDRAEILSVKETVTTPAGKFTNCLKTEETTPLEPDVKEYKYYAPGVGLVQDAFLKLVKHEKTESL